MFTFFIFERSIRARKPTRVSQYRVSGEYITGVEGGGCGMDAQVGLVQSCLEGGGSEVI